MIFDLIIIGYNEKYHKNVNKLNYLLIVRNAFLTI